MRENTKWVMIVTALAFVALMVFEWGMDASGQTSADVSGGVLGRVNGEPVSYEEYSTVLRSLYDERQQLQQGPITGAQNREIENQAWDQVVMQKLIRQEIRNRGIRVTEAEVRQAARYAPPPEFVSNELFQTDGQFDLQKYHQFLASPAVDATLLLQLEAYYRDLIPRTRLFQQVAAGASVTDGELWRQYREQTETASVRYIAIDPQLRVPDEAVSVSDREISSYYQSNRDDFRQPERASIRLTVLEKQPTAVDTAAAREHASRLRREILDGASFAEVAERESADPGSAQRGGSLGSFQRGMMVPAFEQAVWSQPIGRVGEPVLTQFGYHLIEVESRTADEATARHILVRIELTPESEDALLALADSLEALGEQRSLADAAGELGLRVREAEINPEVPFVPGVGRIDDGGDWAFDEAAPGDVSPLFETQDAFYMLELVDRTPAYTLSLQDATPTIRTRLIASRKLERARELGRQIVDDVRRGADLDAVARAHGLEVREAGPFTRYDFVPGLGAATPAIGTAFGLRAGQVSGAVESENVIVVLQVAERSEADREAWEGQKELQRMRTLAGLERQRVEQFLDAIRESARITDNRAEVLRPVDEQDARPRMPLVF